MLTGRYKKLREKIKRHFDAKNFLLTSVYMAHRYQIKDCEWVSFYLNLLMHDAVLLCCSDNPNN
jgi:hypothetical protein